MGINQYKGTLQVEGESSQSVDLFFTDVTISVRINDATNAPKDIYVLVQDIDRVVVFAHQLLIYVSTQPQYVLCLNDLSSITTFRSIYRKKPFMGKMRYRLWHSIQAKVVIGTMLVIAIVLSGIVWGIPWLGGRLLSAVPKEYEIKIGQELLKPTLGDAVIDSVRTEQVNHFFKALHYPVSYPVQITVIKGEEVNAFALPGGPIVVYSAILDSMQQPEELAALLSHEAAHIQYRHTLRNMLSAAGTRIVIGLMLGDQSAAAALLAEQANTLKGLAYSRSLETEADLQGLQWMQQQQIDPTGMVHLMKVIQVTVKGHEPAAFLSTHPVFDERIPTIEEHIQKNVSIDLQKKKMLKVLFDNLYKPKS